MGRTKQQWLMGALACASALLFSGLAQGQGIATTKHNLGSAATGQNHVTGNEGAGTGTAEICVFCHTPHGAAVNANAPLWNKTLPAGNTYQVYNTGVSSTIDGEVLTVGSVSVTCLSCHDGTQAMDNIINAPGSGGYDSTGGGATGRAWTWDTSTGRVTAEGVMQNANGFIAMLGTDLTNDHPVGIEYCGGGLSGSTPNDTPGIAGGNCKDSDFRQPMSSKINGVGVWWVETGSADTQRKRNDMILYTRTFTGNAAGPSVECASCHDPHVAQGQAGPTGTNTTGGRTFLRIDNASSAVCLACHTK